MQNIFKRAISLVLSICVVASMLTMIAGISAFAATQTPIIESLDPANWDYTNEEGKFYFDNASGRCYNDDRI